MKRLLTIFVGSFHSAQTYREVRHSQRFAMGYAFFVVALCTLLIVILLFSKLHRELFTAPDNQPPAFDHVVHQIAEQIPEMTYNNERLESSVPNASTIRISATVFGQTLDDTPFITIDTSGAMTDATMPTPVAVNATQLMMKSGHETQIYPLRDFLKNLPQPFVIDRSTAERFADAFTQQVHRNLGILYLVTGGITWVFFCGYMLVVRLVMVLVLGAIGHTIMHARKSPIPYRSAVAVAAVSYTPVAVLDAILFGGFGYPAQSITLLLAGTVTLYAALKASDGLAPRPDRIG